MIGIISFFLTSYLIMAVSYTIEALIDVKDECLRYWYMLPFVFFWCLLMCWFYFPCDVGFKLYKKLNEEEKEKR